MITKLVLKHINPIESAKHGLHLHIYEFIQKEYIKFYKQWLSKKLKPHKK